MLQIFAIREIFSRKRVSRVLNFAINEIGYLKSRNMARKWLILLKTQLMIVSISIQNLFYSKEILLNHQKYQYPFNSWSFAIFGLLWKIFACIYLRDFKILKNLNGTWFRENWQKSSGNWVPPKICNTENKHFKFSSENLN